MFISISISISITPPPVFLSGAVTSYEHNIYTLRSKSWRPALFVFRLTLYTYWTGLYCSSRVGWHRCGLLILIRTVVHMYLPVYTCISIYTYIHTQMEPHYLELPSVRKNTVVESWLLVTRNYMEGDTTPSDKLRDLHVSRARALVPRQCIVQP